MTAVDSPLARALRDRYVLERELGRGGMATVYLARDLRHERFVALKVLHPELAASVGPERFLREIHTTARLQHPHILSVHDSGDTAGQLWFTMPFVEGESLRDRLRRERQLPIDDAVRITREAALALQYAHAHGIIHRDVKPENMLLTVDGSTLVADFGIARALGGSDERLTETGLAVGTPTYMSPEQATGEREMGARSDIYSLGCVLYEMLAGQPPFTGTTARAVLARHAVDPVPALRTVRPSVPEPVERAIGRALAKVPADRYPTARAFAEALVDASEASAGSSPRADAATGRPPTSSGGTVRVSGPGTTSRAIIVAGIIVAAGVLGVLWRFRAAAGAGAGARQTQLTFVGNAERQEISPDGQLLAYVERGDSLRVFVKDLMGNSVIPIATFGDITTLRWSPDGTMILCDGEVGNYRRVAALYPRLGGTPRLLPRSVFYSALSQDGAQLASWSPPTERGMVVTTLGTGAERSISLSDDLGWLNGGDWSPNGRWIALLSTSKNGNRWMLWDIDPDSGVTHEVVSDTVPLSAPRWSPAGDALYYLRDGNELRKIAITPQGVTRAAPDILQAGLGATHFSITADGTRLAYTKEQGQSNLWLATLSGAPARFSTIQLTRGSAEKTPGRLSPDGHLVAFLQKESGRADVYVIPAEGGVPRRVTSTGIAAAILRRPPAWSPDGRQLAFVATLQGSNHGARGAS